MLRRLLLLSVPALFSIRLLACASVYGEADAPPEADASSPDAGAGTDAVAVEDVFVPDADAAEPPCVTGQVRTQTRSRPNLAQTTGTLNTTFGAVSTNGQPWNGVAFAKTSDDQWAAFFRSAEASATESSFLVLQDFGFGVPATARVTGLAVSVERHGVPVGPVKDLFVGVLKGGLGTGGYKTGVGEAGPTTSDQAVTFGGSSYLWGDTWFGVDTNDTTFGVFYAAGFVSDAGLQASYVDGVSVIVSYECP